MKVKAINDDSITFENGITLTSDHEQDCCESHYLDLSGLKLDDFEGLEFDLTGDTFFERVPDYGIRLLPTNGQLDHNHKTGQIRGVLCSYCNVTLGGIENKEFLENAIKYLKKYETRETRDTGGTS